MFIYALKHPQKSTYRCTHTYTYSTSDEPYLYTFFFGSLCSMLFILHSSEILLTSYLVPLCPHSLFFNALYTQVIFLELYLDGQIDMVQNFKCFIILSSTCIHVEENKQTNKQKR